jgi:hypothetical protein
MVMALVLITSAPVWADDLRVAVGDLRGRGLRDRNIGHFQKQLKRVEGIKIQSTRGFRDAAKRLGLSARDLGQDPRGLADTAARADVGAVIYGLLRRGRSRKDRIIRLSVYEGRTGQLVGEHDIDVPRGRFTQRVWEDAARAVAPDLYKILDGNVAPPASPEPAPDMTFSAPVPVAPPPRPRFERQRPVLRIHAGFATTARTFSYETAPSTTALIDGVSYESSLVPGLALDLEAYPGQAMTNGFAAGFGLGVRFEKVFLSTEQVDPATSEAVSLDTQHQHLLLRALYRRALGAGPTAIELVGHLGYGLLSFEVEENKDYRGATWSYLDLGIGASIPLTTPLAALDLEISVLPGADLGDRTEELGKEASSFGYRIYGGVSSLIGGGLSLMAGGEYTSFSTEVTGEGRDGRVGQAASDAYLTFRLMAGYRY